ncbi:hypothetical protein ACG98H_12235 [Corynebacterium sp. L4756]|uniref:hypothetical protein n=1 Tax=unclassified Corynebacterium TaxID=2624378 RepID=UPI00374CE2D5
MSTATQLAQHVHHAENNYAEPAEFFGPADAAINAAFAYSQASASYAAEPAVGTAVLRVSGMPARLRPAVERAMVQCIHTTSEYVVPGDDPLTAQWCTRWYRDNGMRDDLASLAAFPGVELPEPRAEKCVGCRQVITGTASEFRALNSVLTTLAEEFGFDASVQRA